MSVRWLSKRPICWRLLHLLLSISNCLRDEGIYLLSSNNFCLRFLPGGSLLTESYSRSLLHWLFNIWHLFICPFLFRSRFLANRASMLRRSWLLRRGRSCYNLFLSNRSRHFFCLQVFNQSLPAFINYDSDVIFITLFRNIFFLDNLCFWLISYSHIARLFRFGEEAFIDWTFENWRFCSKTRSHMTVIECHLFLGRLAL